MWLLTSVLLFGLFFFVEINGETTASVSTTPSIPNVTPERWLPADTDYTETADRPWKPVYGCCVLNDDDSILTQTMIGRMPQFTTQDARSVLENSVRAWNGGMGVWPQMSLPDRIVAIENFFQELSKKKEEIVQVLMWEIGKNRADATAEFERTLQFAQALIETLRTTPEYAGRSWQSVGSTQAVVRRSAIGVIMCLAPYNYPINESYATIIPALLLGNVVLVKIPTVGGLAHLLTMEAFQKTLPPGTINFIAGSGRATMPPLMQTGKIDGLAFIGGSTAADDLIHKHPHPHRLKVFLQLEANNMGILLPDIFERGNEDILANALNEAVLGSLSYNGQRCTALKLFFAPAAHAESFAKQLASKIEALPVGLPWQSHEGGSQSKITPLPNHQRIEYMKTLLEDALSKGAKVINREGGTVIGGDESTLMVPAVLYPVTPDMTIYHVEQFGPLVPVTSYQNLDSILEFGRTGPYAQQVSIFTGNPETSAMLVDKFSSIFAKINLNTQCGRSPDVLPFAGRRSSAMGVMSVSDALREFSVPTAVAYKHKETVDNRLLASQLTEQSVFLKPLAEESNESTA